MEGAARYADAINFYKNISIIGGFLLLYVTGAGRYSVDRREWELSCARLASIHGWRESRATPDRSLSKSKPPGSS